MKKLLQNLTRVFFLPGIVLFSAHAFAQQTHTITINNGSYSPSSLTINEGDAVVFQLGVGAANNHPTVAENGEWTTFTLANPGDQSGTFTLAVGSHPYYCSNHGAAGGIGMSGTITVNALTGTHSAKVSKYRLTIAPNPFDSEVTLNIDPNRSELTHIKITDMLGNEVAFIDLKSKASSGYKLDFTHLQPGVYFCNLYSDKGILETRKLLRTK